MGSDEEEEVEFLSCDDNLNIPAEEEVDSKPTTSGFSSSTGVPGLLLSSCGSPCSCCPCAAALPALRREGLWDPRAESLDDDLYAGRPLCFE